MTSPRAGTDLQAADLRQGRVWKALAFGLALIVILETAVLLREPAGAPAPATTAISVPDFVGRSIADTRMIADALGLEIQPTGQVGEVPIPIVLEQNPMPGATVVKGSVVHVVVATTAAEAVVPDLLGLPEARALRLLADAGLLPGVRRETPAPLIEPGAVAFQDPAAGARVPRGTPVTYSIATGAVGPSAGATTRPTPQVPSPVPPVASRRVGDYLCMSLPEATKRIRADGFAIGRVSYSIEGGPVDDTWAVVRQDPAPRSTLARGAPIDVLMASPFGICARPSTGS